KTPIFMLIPPFELISLPSCSAEAEHPRLAPVPPRESRGWPAFADHDEQTSSQSGKRLGHCGIDQRAQIAPQRQAGLAADDLRHEHDREILLRVDPEGGGGGA